MGCFGSKALPPNPQEVDLTHFELLKVVGKGGFGKVNAVTKLDTGELMALKRMEKYAVLQSSSHLKMVWIERKIMSLTASPFLCNLLYAFENERELFLIMPFMQGGDLRFHLKERGPMPVPMAQFYACEMILGLQAMHEKRVVFRDLKPDNMLLDAQGHLRISDFGLACILEERNHWLTTGQAGTRGYQSPEVVTDQLYGCEADIFSFGVCCYELLHGARPWKDWTRLQHLALAQQALAAGTPLPDKGAAATAAAAATPASPVPLSPMSPVNTNGISDERSAEGGPAAAVKASKTFHISSKLDPVTADFLQRILHLDKKKQLGCGPLVAAAPSAASSPMLTGWEEVKAHAWFRDVDWGGMARKEIPPPLVPDSTRANCTADADLADQLLDRKPRDIPPEQQARFAGWKFRTEVSPRPEPAAHNPDRHPPAAVREQSLTNTIVPSSSSGSTRHQNSNGMRSALVVQEQTPPQ